MYLVINRLNDFQIPSSITTWVSLTLQLESQGSGTVGLKEIEIREVSILSLSSSSGHSLKDECRGIPNSSPEKIKFSFSFQLVFWFVNWFSWIRFTVFQLRLFCMLCKFSIALAPFPIMNSDRQVALFLLCPLLVSVKNLRCLAMGTIQVKIHCDCQGREE